MTFLDTNVLIYAVDPRDMRKQQIAKSIVMSARNSSEMELFLSLWDEKQATRKRLHHFGTKEIPIHDKSHDCRKISRIKDDKDI